MAKNEKYKQTTEEDSWFIKTWNTQRGRASLKLGIYAIFIVFILILIIFKTPRQKQQQVINYSLDSIKEKESKTQNIAENNYHFEYNLVIDGNKIKYYGDKNKNIEVGYKEDSTGIIKYYKENDLVYKVGLDSKDIIDNLYLNVNVNYLSYFYIDSLIKDLTPTVIDNSEVYQIDSNLKITYVKDNNIITNIIVNDSYNTYDLKYTKINKIPTIGETYEY